MLVATVSDMLRDKLASVEGYYRGVARSSKIIDEDDLISDVLIFIEDIRVRYPRIEMDSSEFDAVLRQTVRNHIVDLARHRKRRPTLSIDAAPAEPIPCDTPEFYWTHRSDDPLHTLDFAERLCSVRCRLTPRDEPLWRFLTSSWDASIAFENLYRLNKARGLSHGKYRWTAASIAAAVNLPVVEVRSGLRRIRSVVADVFGIAYDAGASYGES